MIGIDDKLEPYLKLSLATGIGHRGDVGVPYNWTTILLNNIPELFSVQAHRH